MRHFRAEECGRMKRVSNRFGTLRQDEEREGDEEAGSGRSRGTRRMSRQSVRDTLNEEVYQHTVLGPQDDEDVERERRFAEEMLTELAD